MIKDVKEYREAIYQAMIAMTDAQGNAVVTPKEARELIDDFSDDELEDGILYNTPEEVASFLLFD